jgi:putative ATP-grasp target RiPP
VPTALQTPGFPRAADFIGSVDDLDVSRQNGGDDHPFGLRFLTPVTTKPDVLAGLRYDPERQRAYTDVALPQAKGTSGPSTIYFETSLDGCAVLDSAADTYSD